MTTKNSWADILLIFLTMSSITLEASLVMTVYYHPVSLWVIVATIIHTGFLGWWLTLLAMGLYRFLKKNKQQSP